MGASPNPERSGSDLLTVVLLVFFVSLTLVVSALMVLPIVFR